MPEKKLTTKQYRELGRELKRLIETYGISEVFQLIKVMAIVQFENRPLREGGICQKKK